MIRDLQWKYVWNPTSIDELYDLETDPGELTNLAQQPGMQNQLRRLRSELIAWMDSITDPMLNCWTRNMLNGARYGDAESYTVVQTEVSGVGV